MPAATAAVTVCGRVYAPALARFNHAMALETEDLELDFERLEQGVRAVLEDPAKGFYTVAERDGQVIGQLLITYEWSDWRNGVFWWVQSVYVAPDHRGQGVYRQIYEAILNQAKQRDDVCGVRLYVEHNNEKAKLTYSRLGMGATEYEMWEDDFVLER